MLQKNQICDKRPMKVYEISSGETYEVEQPHEIDMDGEDNVMVDWDLCEGICKHCHQDVQSFWIEDDDRPGKWSEWTKKE